eukprot:gnl/MRDRNA2_/MRDRNA2_75117_c0_seq2.p1 gnl/MRDRNA2_/MRDRNA2_75117_c0~~gnl/MRDRNA2_/MRDRNA2_75117_c0_seq2.p1  ORF type:complete len:186 (+),score=19.58 gnl/MRDRNA2_/MRDRNA2_75117_c0_seq2:91-648(+)
MALMEEDVKSAPAIANEAAPLDFSFHTEIVTVTGLVALGLLALVFFVGPRRKIHSRKKQWQRLLASCVLVGTVVCGTLYHYVGEVSNLAKPSANITNTSFDNGPIKKTERDFCAVDSSFFPANNLSFYGVRVPSGVPFSDEVLIGLGDGTGSHHHHSAVTPVHGQDELHHTHTHRLSRTVQIVPY